MSQSITFRPHHFLCTLGFQGKGYSPNFIRNYQTIVDQLQKPDGDNTSITVIDHTDSICAPCPHRQELSCATQEKIDILDKNHAKTLQLKVGDTLTWGQAKQRLKKHMTLEAFHHNCASCEWKKLGTCETSLKHFLQQK